MCKYVREKSIMQVNNMDVENPNPFPKAKRVLTVVRSGQNAQQILAMTEEANAINIDVSA